MDVLRLVIVVAAVSVVTGVITAPAVAQTSSGPVVNARALPPNNPAQGLIYDGLATEVAPDPCARAYKLVTNGGCTPGPDRPPAGLNVAVDVPALPAAHPRVECDGTGKRVQVVYARASDAPDRFAQFEDSIRQWAGQVDKLVRDSAAEFRGERHVRFVTDADCAIDVANLVMDPAGDDTFDATVTELRAHQMRAKARKYLVFVDANVYCGISEVVDDDSHAAGNGNNYGANAARIDAGCWNGEVAAHELMHLLGAVQLSAPHSSGDWHCNGAAPSRPFGCEPSDWFDVSPAAGSYLETHWNVALSDYLVRTPSYLWGYVWANQPASASYTPNPDFQRNSTNAVNTIERTGPGVYEVKFPNLGVNEGTVDVTAYGPGSKYCKVSDWGHSYAELTVRVRCFSAAGAAADSSFTAAFVRATGWDASARFAYVWADQASAAGTYLPDAAYSYNSSADTNEVTRAGLGRYNVRLKGLGGDSGVPKVTAWGTGAQTCNIMGWERDPAQAADELVRVACHSATGSLVDSRFTLTFHGNSGILGLADRDRAHIFANLPSVSSYGVLPHMQFNSTGALNTVSHSTAPGVYQVRLRGLALSGGHVQVTAVAPGLGSPRCKVAGWIPANGTDQLVNVLCFDSSGFPADAQYVVSYVA